MKILSIDFDGTIVNHAYPKIGDPMPLAFEVMKELKENGWKLILWTCREDDGFKIDKQYLRDAVKFCENNGVVFDAVNSTIEEEDFRSENSLKRKPYCTHFIDDSNLGGFPGWNHVRKLLLGNNELDVKSLKVIKDLVYYDGPLITLRACPNGQTWISHWCDTKDKQDTILFVPLEGVNLLKYLCSKMPLRDAYLSVENVYLVIQDFEENVVSQTLMKSKDIPE